MNKIRQKIAEIIDVPDTDYWQVIDSRVEEGLYLIHYSPEANLDKYGFIRGLVVDINNKKIVAKSFGFTPKVKSKKLTPNESNVIILQDNLNPGVEYTINTNKVNFYPGFEGVVVKVFIHNNKIYHSTYKRLEADDRIIDIYKNLGGPSKEDLFGSQENSNYVYLFMIADPSLQIASKTIEDKGYLIYLGYQKMGQESSPLWTKNSSILSPVSLNIEEVNNYLQYGSYDPQNTTEEYYKPSEFVIVYFYDDEGNINDSILIESPNYQWRRSLIDNNKNLYHQFFLLANGKFLRAETPEEREVYLKRFPVLYPYNEEEILEVLPLIYWPDKEVSQEEKENILVEPKRRLYNIYLNFVYSLSLNKQKEALSFYQNYLDDLDMIKSKLIEIDYYNEILGQEIPSRIKNILYLARYNARKSLEKDNKENYRNLVNKFIKDLINAEEGNSLYQILRYLTSTS